MDIPKWLRTQRQLIAERYGAAALSTDDLKQLVKLYRDRRSVIVKRIKAILREQERVGKFRGVQINPTWQELENQYWPLVWENRALQDNIYQIEGRYSLSGFSLKEPVWYRERMPRQPEERPGE